MDGLRRLTNNEIKMLEELYGPFLRYNEIWIHNASYLPLNIQFDNYTMTPNGEMYFMPDNYRQDYSYADDDLQYVFIHESVHIWQYQRGMHVRLYGLYSLFSDYSYSLHGVLTDYSMEQQAVIIADYWAIKKKGYLFWKSVKRNRDDYPTLTDNEIIGSYRKIVCHFPLYYF